MHQEMGADEDNRTDRARELYVLSDKIEELHRTQEELRRAKDEAMQSWLDSRPLIDELERLQADLANAKEQSENKLVSELESELVAINAGIRAKKEEELRLRTEINEMTRASEGTREELERIKLETNEGKRARSKLKQVIKLRRQTLRTLKLTLRATRLESEAYGASAEAALHQISRARMNDDATMVELTQEDYFALTRRAKEETSLADWRVVVATEQRLVAEESRDLALERLREMTINGVSTNKKTEGELSDKEVPMVGFRARSPFPKARVKLISKRGIKSDTNHRGVDKKKRSIFGGIKSFLTQKMKNLFR